jgi:cell wall integrity and stress response component
VKSTVLVTVSGKPVQSEVGSTATITPKESGPNKAGIAAGVIVGVIALGAIVGGVVFFIRRKKQKELEDERRRHEAITSFVTRGEKPPSTFSASDSRLEPSVMFQRRQSDGSIADNQDYSRRILQVGRVPTSS